MDVRTERPEDVAGIRAVHLAAFPGPGEADLVDALRAGPAWIADLSLVAVEGDAVVGHLLVSRAHLDTGSDVLVLAPMAVDPALQGRGVGSRLVREAVARARRTALPLLVVLGHAGYYPRFGFGSATALGVTAPFDVPDEAWMALALPAWTPAVRGTVVYPPPFAAV